MSLVYERLGMQDSVLVVQQRYLTGRHDNRRRWDPIYLARAYESLGQLHEARGEVEEAIKYHSLFIDLWSEADPELQPRVDAARRALERLQAEASSASSEG